MTITEQVVKNIIRKLLKGDDYRIEIVSLIDAELIQFTIDFFKKVAEAKLNNEKISSNWYKSVFLDDKLDKSDIAINAGLNMKTIGNMFNSTKKEIVIAAANEHYDLLYQSITHLVEHEDNVDLTLTIKMNGVSIDLTVDESLIVINTIAVKRAALRGGLWSTVGKRAEKPLMKTLCKLYSVPEVNFNSETKNPASDQAFEREIDFYLMRDNEEYKCEVKLMGKGNPESADAIIARGSNIFIADKLSDTNKKQLDSLEVEWVELREVNGFRRFKIVLEHLQIPHSELPENELLDEKIEAILEHLFND